MFKKLIKRIFKRKSWSVGRLTFWLHDPRNPWEKFVDCLLDFVEKQERMIKEQEYIKKLMSSKSLAGKAWHSEFNYSLGRVISSSQEFRELERSGMICTTYDEVEKTAKKVKTYKKEQARGRIREDVKQSIADIRKGRSFVQEAQERAKSCGAGRDQLVFRG